MLYRLRTAINFKQHIVIQDIIYFIPKLDKQGTAFKSRQIPQSLAGDVSAQLTGQ